MSCTKVLLTHGPISTLFVRLSPSYLIMKDGLSAQSIRWNLLLIQLGCTDFVDWLKSECFSHFLEVVGWSAENKPHLGIIRWSKSGSKTVVWISAGIDHDK